MDTSGKDKHEEPEKPEKFEETEDSGSEMKSKDTGSTDDPDEWEFAFSKKGFEAEMKRVCPDFDFSPETMKSMQIKVEKKLVDVIRRANAIARLEGREILRAEDIRAVTQNVNQNGEEAHHEKVKNEE